MDEKNFAVCIGPTLLRGPEATEEMIAVASGTVSKVLIAYLGLGTVPQWTSC